MGFPLIMDSGNGVPLVICLNCSGRFIPTIDTIVASYFRYQLVGLPLSVICSGHPVELDKPHILALAAETGFFLFQEQVPLKFKKRNISGSMRKEDLLIDITLNLCVVSLDSLLKALTVEH
jgi:hypothetical protein